jgi:DNA polymerase-1
MENKQVTPINGVEFYLVSSLDELYTTPFYSDLEQVDAVGFDTESTGLDYFNETLLLVQFEVNGISYVIDVVGMGHEELNTIIQDIKNKGVQCIAHNAKYDIQVIRFNTGIRFENVHCTMIAENVLGAGLEDFYLPLDQITNAYLSIELDKLLRDQFIGSTVVVQEQLEYAAEDVAYLRQLRDLQLGRAKALDLTGTVNLENKLVPVVAWQEYEGVALDSVLWEELTHEATQAAEELKVEVLDQLFGAVKEDIMDSENALEACAKLHVTHKKTKKMVAHLEGITEPEYVLSTVRENFNINSYKQLLAILNLYGIPTTSTNQKILEQFKLDYPIIKPLLEYKQNAKLVSSFGKDFIQRINPATGRLHASANQLGARSGRWSYSKPNLQQIPKLREGDEDKRGILYRQCFIARPDHKLLTVDYDQAELRLLGAVANEPEFIEAYKNDIDIHKLTATKIFGVELEDVTDIQRWTAKQINFAIVYGSSAYGLEFNFNIPVEEGEQHLANYYKAYPYIKSFMDMAGDRIWDLKYTRTPFGRKRFFEDVSYFSDMYEANRYMNKVKRQGINTIIQGVSADILKLALVDIYYNNPFGDYLKILMTVHDEGVYEIHDDVTDEATEYVVECMERNEQVFLGEIPAKVDYKVADTWSK